MDSSRLSPTFEEMREQLGLRPRLLYSLKTVAEVTGVPYDTLLKECKGGRLRNMQAGGPCGARRLKAAWVDRWIEEGTDGCAA